MTRLIISAAMLLVLLTTPTQAGVDYVILVTGDELLAGTYADAHTLFLTRTLRPLGLRCVGSISVDDRAEDIQEALRYAGRKAKLIIMTGGLGPTENDITRETLAAHTGIELKEDPAAVREMAARLKTPIDQLRPNLRRQALTPAGGTYLKNANGTAVGLVYETPTSVIVALPGPPRELQPMVRDEMVPWLSKRFGTSLPGESLTIRFVGLGQSQISQTLKDRVTLPKDVLVGSQFEGSRVDYTFTLPEGAADARGRLAALKQQILTHLGQQVYADGETTLDEHVAMLLKSRGATLAVAEAGSGGSLAAALSSASSGREVLAGAFAAPTEEKLRRLMKVADAGGVAMLAGAAAESGGARWAVAVGEVRTGNDGQYVEVVLRRPDGAGDVQRIPVRGSGELARANLTTQLLDWLRQQLR